jgi:hypothetical protein
MELELVEPRIYCLSPHTGPAAQAVLRAAGQRSAKAGRTATAAGAVIDCARLLTYEAQPVCRWKSTLARKCSALRPQRRYSLRKPTSHDIRALENPAVAAQTLGRLDAAAGDARDEAASA